MAWHSQFPGYKPVPDGFTVFREGKMLTDKEVLQLRDESNAWVDVSLFVEYDGYCTHGMCLLTSSI